MVVSDVVGDTFRHYRDFRLTFVGSED
jgi:hypothetical protein